MVMLRGMGKFKPALPRPKPQAGSRSAEGSRIDLYLANHYAAAQLGKGNPAFSEAAFRQLIEADQRFRKEAEAKLALLTKPILDRDHVSRMHHIILQKVLANV